MKLYLLVTNSNTTLGGVVHLVVQCIWFKCTSTVHYTFYRYCLGNGLQGNGCKMFEGAVLMLV